MLQRLANCAAHRGPYTKRASGTDTTRGNLRHPDSVHRDKVRILPANVVCAKSVPIAPESIGEENAEWI